MRIKGVVATMLLAVVLVGAVVEAHPAGAASPPYRRWSGAKAYTCAQGSGDVSISFANQDVEFGGDLAAGDQYGINYVSNGSYTTDGPFDVEQLSGTKSYGAFSDHAAAFPFTYQFRLDTIVNGSVVYTSELKVTCAGPSSGTATPVNTVVPTDPYRRWSGPRAFSCVHSGSDVSIVLADTNVEFNDLPDGAQYRLHVISDGSDTTYGPNPVERYNGKEEYDPFQQPFPSYPFTFEYRMDTIIGGKVTYTSKVGATCSADRSGVIQPVNAVVTPAPFGSWSDFVKRQFMDLTDSPPSATSLSNWVTALSTGAKTKGELIDGLRRGTDNTSHVDPVVRLYRAFLQRTPDAGGLKFWITRHRTGTWSLNKISQAFATSHEFTTKYGTLTNRQFVTRIYTDVLGRAADTAGVNFWTKQIDSRKRNRGTVMVGFSESSEYKRKQAENTDAIVSHVFLLGHAPSLLELNGWVSRQKDGMSQAELAKEMLTSTAYADRITS